MTITIFVPKNELQANRLIIIFSIIVLTLSLILSYFHQVGSFGVESDFYGVYAIQAQRILQGQTYTYQHNPPGYCLLLAAVTFFVGDAFTAGKLISALSLFFFINITYLLFKDLFDYPLAWLTSIFTALTLLPASFLAATDIVSALLIILSLYYLLSSRNNYFLSGIIAGIAYLFRTNAVFVIIASIIVILLVNINQEKVNKRLIKVMISLGGFILVVIPWLIYNAKVNGNAFSNTAYLQIAANFYHSSGDNLITSVQEMESQFNSLWEVISYQPFHLLNSYLVNVLFLNIVQLFIPLELLDNSIFKIIAILPFLWISIGSIKLVQEQKDNQKIIALSVIILLGYLLLGLVGFHRRYYFFVYPLVFLVKIYVTYRKKVTQILLINLMLVVFLASAIESYLTLQNEPRYLLAIAPIIKNTNSSGKIMIVRKPHLAYLSNAIPAFPLAQTTTEYLDAAREINADYLVYSDYEASLWSGLNALSNPDNLAKEFQVIYRHQPTETIVYQRK